MKNLLITIAFSIYAFASFAQKGSSGKAATPFEIVVYDSDYSMAITYQYVLTNNAVKIVHKAELVGEKDSVLFQAKFNPDTVLKVVSCINIDSLKERYTNICVNDGSQITVVISKGGSTKSVHLSNYYRADIAAIIQLINTVVPEEYYIWYDKDDLIERMKNCKGIDNN